MANVLHKNITGTDLHEPKGVASATQNQVYVANGSGSGSWFNLLPVGSIVDFAGATEPTGWLFSNGETIGNASSGGTARANADTSRLFVLLWESSTNSELIIQNSSGVNTTRGADAATDFAANKRMPLPDYCGRVSAGRDNMGVSSQNRLTAQTGGVEGDTQFAVGGTETHTLTSGQLASHTHTQQGTMTSGAGTAHSHGAGTLAVNSLTVSITNGTTIARNFQETKDSYSTSGGGNQNAVQDVSWNDSTLSAALASGALSGTSASESTHTHDVTLSGQTASTGSGTAHNNVQPTIIMTKLIYYGV